MVLFYHQRISDCGAFFCGKGQGDTVHRFFKNREFASSIVLFQEDDLSVNIRKRAILLFIIVPFLFSSGFVNTARAKAPFAGEVVVIKVSATINPAISEFISSSIDNAEERSANALIIQLDTPGGLDLAMRDIIKRILSAEVPVIVFVSPSGARAASAGVLITLASDIAAMAPGTNIGAAHPVAIGGGKMDETMADKIANDAAAYARSIAEKKGRNAEWAEEAVRKSTSLTEKEALGKKVIEIIAEDLSDLIEKVDGMEIEKNGKQFIVESKAAVVVFHKMGLRHKILNALSDPNVAYILLMLGIYGVFFELSNPGAIFPGVVGGICLILGFYALQTLSVNYAGFLLIALAMILFILEIKVQSYGMLSVGGVISLFLGSIMLFHSKDSHLRISMKTIVPMIVLSALFFGAIIFLAVRAQKQRPRTGFHAIVGEAGKATSDITKTGRVFVAGEIWEAESDETIQEGEEIVVTGQEGFKLFVKRKTERKGL
jgi:membrane-bound serine protease (ClpP class)